MNICRVLLAGFLSLSVSFAHAANNTNLESIPQGIERILQSSKAVDLRNVNVGIVIQSMQTGQVIYERNPNRLYSPASVLKLFTAAAALDFLKPNFIYRTQLLATGPIRNGVLEGDLYVKFSGDPQFKVENLKQLMHQIRRSGIQSIAGNVYIDNSAYNLVAYPPGWNWDDLIYSYAAPMNAIIINHNIFSLHFQPGKTSGQRPYLWTDLPPGVVNINNQTTTITQRGEFCPVHIASEPNNTYTVTGCLDKRWGIQHRTLAMRDITPYATALIHNILQNEKVSYRNKISPQKLPRGTYILAEYNSPPLYKIVYKMLKDSDNLATNSLFKKLGETYFQTSGSWQNGLSALKEILARTGIDFKQNFLADGSGLSRYNLITTRQLSKLLYYVYHNPQVREPFVKALPIAGKDGTLIGRMLSMGRSGRIHAKTGTMTGVTSLAGFINTKHNGVLSFVIMVNGFAKENKRNYTHLQDKICEYLVDAQGQARG